MRFWENFGRASPAQVPVQSRTCSPSTSESAGWNVSGRYSYCSTTAHEGANAYANNRMPTREPVAGCSGVRGGGCGSDSDGG